eukprot:1159995-Pelagomonas_calceolata.AAC.6
MGAGIFLEGKPGGVMERIAFKVYDQLVPPPPTDTSQPWPTTSRHRTSFAFNPQPLHDEAEEDWGDKDDGRKYIPFESVFCSKDKVEGSSRAVQSQLRITKQNGSCQGNKGKGRLNESPISAFYAQVEGKKALCRSCFMSAVSLPPLAPPASPFYSCFVCQALQTFICS